MLQSHSGILLHSHVHATFVLFHLQAFHLVEVSLPCALEPFWHLATFTCACNSRAVHSQAFHLVEVSLLCAPEPFWHLASFTCACSLHVVRRRDQADQQPFSVRRPDVSLWPDNRLPQTHSSNHLGTPISHPAAIDPSSLRAAEQSSIYNLAYRSKHQVS